MNLKEIISKNPREFGTLATAFFLEEVYIGAGRKFICSSWDSMCYFIAENAEKIYKSMYPF